MGDHFAIASWARDAVIAGSLDALRSPLASLASHRYEDLPSGGWVEPMARLQAAARLTSTAATLQVAAVGVATMARVCGECHVENHAGPRLPEPPTPAKRRASETLSERMGQHLWASELLWEGLIGPSEATWKAGSARLIEAPAQLDAVLPSNFDARLRELRSLGEKAGEAGNLAARADVYAALITTCAGCHSRWIESEG